MLNLVSARHELLHIVKCVSGCWWSMFEASGYDIRGYR